MTLLKQVLAVFGALVFIGAVGVMVSNAYDSTYKKAVKHGSTPTCGEAECTNMGYVTSIAPDSSKWILYICSAGNIIGADMIMSSTYLRLLNLNDWEDCLDEGASTNCPLEVANVDTVANHFHEVTTNGIECDRVDCITCGDK